MSFLFLHLFIHSCMHAWMHFYQFSVSFHQDSQMSSFNVTPFISECLRFLSPNHPRLDVSFFTLAFYSCDFLFSFYPLLRHKNCQQLFSSLHIFQYSYLIMLSEQGSLKKLKASKKLFSIKEKYKKVKAKFTHRKTENS